MLSTIIYRSHLSADVPLKTLEYLAVKANKKNEQHDVTGILLFNGTHFFQVLEGPEQAVLSIYNGICNDPRHNNLVELLRDYAPSRRFGNVGMELFDLRDYDKESVLQSVLDKGTSKYQLTYKDRALQFLRTFVEAREKENYFEIPPADYWDFVIDTSSLHQQGKEPGDNETFNCAIQPVVDPFSCQIVSLEALIAHSDDNAPLEHLSPLAREKIYQADLQSKKTAFALAKKLDIAGQAFSVNLLPMTLVSVPGAVNFLLSEIEANGLVPEQIVVAVTEHDVISRIDEVETAIKQLKAAGISLAIDNFGAGYAGLSLLVRFQPDRVKIDQSLICDVHKSGPKQAIVQAIIKCCSSLEISVTATGVKKAEDWMWLEAAGIFYFQGDLFSKPQQNGVPAVAWPEKS